MKKSLLHLACLASLLLFSSMAGGVETSFHLVVGDVVALLGGTNLVNLQKDGSFEALLTAACPDAKAKFRDLAWEGDTVYQQGTVIERWRQDKFGELRQQLTANEVTVAILQFGQSEALQGTEQLSDFIEAYEGLLSIVQSAPRRVVLISPIAFEKTNEPLPDLSRRNQELARYVSAVAQLAAARECVFVNLFAEFSHRETPRLTKNGLHVTPSQQGTVAAAIVRQLALPHSNHPNLGPLRDAVTRKHQLWMKYWRPANWKCLYGDDGERQFGKASGGGLTLRQEWQQLPELIERAEERIWELALQRKAVTNE